jgi:hypothetical protein
VAAVSTAAEVSSVTADSIVAGIPVILASLLLLASLMLFAHCHVVETHSVDGIHGRQRSYFHNFYDFTSLLLVSSLILPEY